MSAYNCEKFVGDAITSVINQTYQNWELFVADDGSTDQTKHVIDSFQDPRIKRYHNDRNIGLLQTWNKLITLGNGDLIAWQDADDTSFPERLEKQVNAFDTDPDLMLCGSNFCRKLLNNRIVISSDYPTQYEEIRKVIDEKKIIPFVGPSRMIRRNVLLNMEAFRPFFEGLGWEDMDFVLRVSEKYKIINLHDVLYEYRYNRGSSTKTRKNVNNLRYHIDKVGFFLAEQRYQTGVDGLMPGGNKSELLDFLNEIEKEINTDPSLSYRRSCRNKISNKDYYYALLEFFHAFCIDPSVQNLKLLPLLLGSFFHTYAKLSLAGLRANLQIGQEQAK